VAVSAKVYSLSLTTLYIFQTDKKQGDYFLVFGLHFARRIKQALQPKGWMSKPTTGKERNETDLGNKRNNTSFPS
jgi:hypothetical protein